jgi:cell wall-associated NlpC family hydrolase
VATLQYVVRATDDASAAFAKIAASADKLNEDLNKLDGKKATPKLGLDDRQFKLAYDDIGLKLDKLDKRVTTTHMNDDQIRAARIQAERLQLRMDKLNAQRTKIHVDDSALSKLSKMSFLQPSAIGSALALSPALIPLAAQVAAGVGAIGVSFGAAALASAGFGLMATTVLSGASKDLQKLQTLNVALLKATTPAQKKAAEQAIAALKAGWSKGYLDLIDQYQTFQQKWKSISQAITVPTLNVWLPVLTEGLKFLKPLIKPVADAFTLWGITLNTYFKDPVHAQRIRELAAAFGNFAAQQLFRIGQFIGDIAKGVFNLGKDLAASGANFSAFGPWLSGIGDGFLTWSKSAKARADVQGFMQFLHDEGPVVKGILKDLGTILPGIFKGATTVGTLELQALGSFLNLVAKLPPNWQRELTEAAGALLLLSKLGVIKAGLKLVGFGSKLLSGGTLTLGGATAAGEMEAAMRTGGAAAAAEIRAAMAGGGAVAAGEGAAGGAAGAAGAAAKGGVLGWLARGTGLKWIIRGGVAVAVTELIVKPTLQDISSGKGKNWWDNPFGTDKGKGALNSWTSFGHDVEHIVDNVRGAITSSSSRWSAALTADSKKATAAVTADFTRQETGARGADRALGNYTQAIKDNGIGSQAATTQRKNLIADLVQAGVNAGTARTDVNRYTTAVRDNGVNSDAARAARRRLVTDIGDAFRNSQQGKTDLQNYTTAVRKNGTDSDAARSSRSKLISDLRSSGLTSDQAKTLVNRLTTAIGNIPKNHNTNVTVTGSGHGGVAITSTFPNVKANLFIHPLASGGMVRGRGGPTADANLALLSHGEYVQKAAAVAKYGVKAMDAINAGRAIVRYAAGGLVGQVAGAGTMYTETGKRQTTMTAGEAKLMAAEVMKEFKAAAAAGSSSAIVRDAKQYLYKIPYVWGGTAVPGGADCSGFVQTIYSRHGISAPRTSEAQGAWVRRSAPVPGGLAFYNSPAGGPPPGHVAIVADAGHVISQGGGMGPQWENLRFAPLMWTGVPPAGFKKMGGGGVLREPVLGYGRSGQGYALAENGPEHVISGAEMTALLAEVRAMRREVVAAVRAAPAATSVGLGRALNGMVPR